MITKSRPSLKSISYTADVGLQAFARPGVTITPHNSHSTIGFTQPTAIYDRMRSLYANAQNLDLHVQYVTDPAFVQGWKAWFANYVPLYERYAGPDASNYAKVAVLSHTDQFSEEIGVREREFASWLADYNRQSQPNGTRVPQITPAGPPSGGQGWGLPWWLWAAGGAAAVGAGYLVYKKFQEGKAKKKVLDKYIPDFLDKYIPGYGKQAAEYARAGRDAEFGRDYPSPAPRGTMTLDDYASKSRDVSRSSPIIDDVVTRYRDPSDR